jgi:AGCS family alanine or glycine:cation symporter
VEVFVDTVLLCTVTALCILVSDSGPAAFGEDVTRTAQAAFSSVLGDWAGGFFAVSMLLFGVATVLCWAHYGMTCVGYLTEGDRHRGLSTGLYTVLLAASLAVGAVASPEVAWSLADAAIALMTLVNLSALLLLQREVAEETDALFLSHPCGGCRICCKENRPRKE